MLQDWKKNGCPLCGSKSVEDVFKINSIPVDVGALWNEYGEALKAAKGEILLTLCTNCGYVGNRAYDRALMKYAPGYEISLHHSPVYQSFLEKLASYLTDRFSLNGKTVVEIGCGQGHFLNLLSKIGNCNGYGFDPSVQEETVEQIGDSTIRLVRDFYSPSKTTVQPDLIVSRHMFQEIEKPKQFLSEISASLGNSSNLALYFEMPNASYAFATAIKWNFMYEYVSYFHSVTLRRLFQNCGLAPTRVTPCYEDDQYLSIEATVQKKEPEQYKETSDLLKFVKQVRQFSQTVESSIKKWQSDLKSYRNKKIVIWGAGGRAISFMSALTLGDEISYLVDINPSRQNMFIPVSGQKVVPPEFIKENKPDLVLVSNPTYENEIRGELNSLGCNPDVRVI